ncbi:12057_t:CDS:1, partial [Acaulospora morrowiae]
MADRQRQQNQDDPQQNEEDNQFQEFVQHIIKGIKYLIPENMSPDLQASIFKSPIDYTLGMG